MNFKIVSSIVGLAIKVFLTNVIIVLGSLVYAQSSVDCSLTGFATDFMKAYETPERLQNVDCYKTIVTIKEEVLVTAAASFHNI